MAIDLGTIDEKLAKAKEDVDFWENVRAVFLDPRISGDQSIPTPTPNPFSASSAPAVIGGFGSRPRAYGEVKRKVLEALPDFGAQPITTTEIASAMKRNGYQFASRSPGIAVNDALTALGNQVVVVGTRGVAKLWTKADPGAGAFVVEDQYQQQTPP